MFKWIESVVAKSIKKLTNMCLDLGKMPRCTPFGEHCGIHCKGIMRLAENMGKIMGSQATQLFFRCVQGMQMDVPYFFSFAWSFVCSFVHPSIHSFIHSFCQFCTHLLVYSFTHSTAQTHTRMYIILYILSLFFSHIIS